MIHSIIEGSTTPQDFVIKDDGVPVDAAGWDVDVEFREAVDGVTVDWLDASVGTVRVSGLGGLDRGTYHFRFKVTVAGETDYAPSGDEGSVELTVKRV